MLLPDQLHSSKRYLCKTLYLPQVLCYFIYFSQIIILVLFLHTCKLNHRAYKELYEEWKLPLILTNISLEKNVLDILPVSHVIGFWLLANMLNIKGKHVGQSKRISILCSLAIYDEIFKNEYQFRTKQCLLRRIKALEIVFELYSFKKFF